MKTTNRTINKHGLKEIETFLTENHKLSANGFSPDMLSAWATEAEFQLDEGNPPSIEIKCWDSIHGYTAVFTISDAGVDTEVVNDEE